MLLYSMYPLSFALFKALSKEYVLPIPAAPEIINERMFPLIIPFVIIPITLNLLLMRVFISSYDSLTSSTFTPSYEMSDL